jgi:hypothetical protein
MLQTLKYPAHFSSMAEYFSFLLSIICYPYWEWSPNRSDNRSAKTNSASHENRPKTVSNDNQNPLDNQIQTEHPNLVSQTDPLPFNSHPLIGTVRMCFLNLFAQQNQITLTSLFTYIVRAGELGKMVAWQIHSLLIGQSILDVLAPLLVELLVSFDYSWFSATCAESNKFFTC